MSDFKADVKATALSGAKAVAPAEGLSPVWAAFPPGSSLPLPLQRSLLEEFPRGMPAVTARHCLTYRSLSPAFLAALSKVRDSESRIAWALHPEVSESSVLSVMASESRRRVLYAVAARSSHPRVLLELASREDLTITSFLFKNPSLAAPLPASSGISPHGTPPGNEPLRNESSLDSSALAVAWHTVGTSSPVDVPLALSALAEFTSVIDLPVATSSPEVLFALASASTRAEQQERIVEALMHSRPSAKDIVFVVSGFAGNPALDISLRPRLLRLLKSVSVFDLDLSFPYAEPDTSGSYPDSLSPQLGSSSPVVLWHELMVAFTPSHQPPPEFAGASTLRTWLYAPPSGLSVSSANIPPEWSWEIVAHRLAQSPSCFVEFMSLLAPVDVDVLSWVSLSPARDQVVSSVLSRLLAPTVFSSPVSRTDSAHVSSIFEVLLSVMSPTDLALATPWCAFSSLPEVEAAFPVLAASGDLVTSSLGRDRHAWAQLLDFDSFSLLPLRAVLEHVTVSSNA